MKITSTITDITKDDLVNLFSTALYGSTWLSASYDSHYYFSRCDCRQDECFEDKLASILLRGGEIELHDGFAEEADEYYGDVCEHVWDDEFTCMTYKVNLQRIMDGIKAALDGTFVCHCDEYEWARRAANGMVADDGSWDITDAELLMQIIMFNEVVY